MERGLAATERDGAAPSNGPAWITDFVNGDHYTGGSSSPAAVAGYPSVTVPAGFVFGLPVGISFIGTRWSEPALLKLAYGWEYHASVRTKPTYMDSFGVRDYVSRGERPRRPGGGAAGRGAPATTETAILGRL